MGVNEMFLILYIPLRCNVHIVLTGMDVNINYYKIKIDCPNQYQLDISKSLVLYMIALSFRHQWYLS